MPRLHHLEEASKLTTGTRFNLRRSETVTCMIHPREHN